MLPLKQAMVGCTVEVTGQSNSGVPQRDWAHPTPLNPLLKRTKSKGYKNINMNAEDSQELSLWKCKQLKTKQFNIIYRICNKPLHQKTSTPKWLAFSNMVQQTYLRALTQRDREHQVASLLKCNYGKAVKGWISVLSGGTLRPVPGTSATVNYDG